MVRIVTGFAADATVRFRPTNFITANLLKGLLD
jgi:hypothetical protein